MRDELVRSEITGPGIRRRRCGRGFRYLGATHGHAERAVLGLL